MKAIVRGTLLHSSAGFARDNSCVSLVMILSVVVSPLRNSLHK